MEKVSETVKHLAPQSAPPSCIKAKIPNGMVKMEPADDSCCALESLSKTDSTSFSCAGDSGQVRVLESTSQDGDSASKILGSVKQEADVGQGQVVMKGEDFWVEVDPHYESEDEPNGTFEVKFEPKCARSKRKKPGDFSNLDQTGVSSDRPGQSSFPASASLPSGGSGVAADSRVGALVPVLSVCGSAIPGVSQCVPAVLPGHGAVSTLVAPVVISPPPGNAGLPGGASSSGSSVRNVAVLDSSGLLQGVIPLAINGGMLGQNPKANENLAIIPRGDGTFNCLLIYGERNPFIPEYEPTRKMDKNYECCECGQRFDQDNHLREHGRTVHGSNKIYRCPECGKKFGYRNTLKTHIATRHTGEGKFPCSVCKKQFDREGHLLTHSATVHRGERKFTCTECGKGFGLKSTLMTHITSVHKQEKQFSCPECGKRFSQRCHLKVHYAGLHKAAAKFSCSECSRTFAFESYLKKHVAVVHRGERNFLCSVCGKTFGEKGSLDIHIQAVHAGVRFSCPDCGEQFRQKSSMKKHTESTHGYTV